MSATRCSVASLRSALNHLYEPRALQRSPLAQALGLLGQLDAVAVLRRTLVEAIESLKPASRSGARSPDWRSYEILHYRYVQQCSQREVADQLGLSLRHLKREQRRALETLAVRLQERCALAIDLGDEAAPDESEAGDTGTAPDKTELEWLREGPPSRAVELGEVLPAVLDLARPMAAQRGVDLQVTPVDARAALAMHAVALRQILLSLLSIGIRQAAGRPLELSARALSSAVEMSMRCEGLADRQPLDTKDEANLAMARQLASVSGATLTVLSPGRAFLAILTLPLAEQMAVLVVDDNLDAIRLLERYAQGTRYRVYGAQDPQRVFALAQGISPRLIVLDVMMPEVDGWELLGRIKEHPLTASLPVVACTILAQEELALSLGVSAFLRKPISRRDFLAALDRLISGGPS